MTEATSKPLEPKQQKAIFTACDDDFLGLRARIVLELSMRFGLRENEIEKLDLRHVSYAHRVWKKRSPSKMMIIPESDQSTPMVETDEQFRDVLKRYLSERVEFVEGNPELILDEAPLIVSKALTRLTQRALRKSLVKIAKSAKVKDLSFHALRATFIRGLWEQTRDVQEVAKRSRVKSPATVIRHIGIAEA